VVQDEFDRTSAVDWASAPIGGLYTYISGNPGQFTTTAAGGGLGRMEFDAADSAGAAVGPNIAALRLVGRIRPEELATGARFDQGVMFRVGPGTSNPNRYEVLLKFETTGAVGMRLIQIVSGATTVPVDISIPYTYTGASNFTIIVEADGGVIRARAFDTATPDPVAWQFEHTETTTALSTGQVGAFARVQAGNTNVPDFFPSWDYLEATDLCRPCVPVTIDTSSTPLTIANDGRFWLKDPVRPCHDRPVPLCQTGSPLLPDCGGDGGILFVGMGPEIYQSNSLTMRPMNRRRTMSATRPRSDASTALRLQTLTFTDRDDLLQLLKPGSPLLFQGPSEYGVPDRYMAVQAVQVQPELPDLRIQIRTETLPYLTEDRPAGPTQGICGARVADICDLYPTWDDLAATGMTWDDLVAGQASPASANPNRRTWDDVNAEFADWDAVNTGGRTWDGLEEGL